MGAIRIAFLIDEYRNASAGTEGQMALLASGLAERGHLVQLGVLRTSEYIDAGGFPAPVERLQVPRIASLRGWWRLYRWGRSLKRSGFAIAQIFFNDAAAMAPWPLRLAGLRVVSCRRDMGYWYTPPVLAMLRIAAPAVDTLLANSHAAGEAAIGREWIPARKLRVIYNGVPDQKSDLAHAQVEEPVPAALPQGRVGIVANIRPVKRIEDLVRAFAAVVLEFPGCELVVVGGGEQSELAALAKCLGVEDRVRFVGQVADPSRWIATFDVGVLCSESEGLSNTILEYMRSGVPVVATRTGGNPELVEHGVTGSLVSVGDVSGLTRAISNLLRQRDLARALGSAARERVRREYSVEKMIDAHLELYESLIPESSWKRCASRSAAEPVEGPR